MKEKVVAAISVLIISLMFFDMIVFAKGPTEDKPVAKDVVLVRNIVKKGEREKSYSNFGCFALDDENPKIVYCVKTAPQNKGSYLVVYKDYKKNSERKVYKLQEEKGKKGKKKSLPKPGHANGLAFYKGKLYLATMAKKDGSYRVNRYSKTGKFEESYRCDFNATCITSCGNGYFILRRKKLNTTTCKAVKLVFTYGKFENGKFVESKSFTVDNPKAKDGYTTGHDINVKSEGRGKFLLSIPMNGGRDSRKNLVRNVILFVKIDVRKDNMTYKPTKIAVLNKKVSIKDKNKVYEIESLDWNGKELLIGGNRTSGMDVIQTLGNYKVK